MILQSYDELGTELELAPPPLVLELLNVVVKCDMCLIKYSC